MLGTVRVRPAILTETEDMCLPWCHALRQRPRAVTSVRVMGDTPYFPESNSGSGAGGYETTRNCLGPEQRAPTA